MVAVCICMVAASAAQDYDDSETLMSIQCLLFAVCLFVEFLCKWYFLRAPQSDEAVTNSDNAGIEMEAHHDGTRDTTHLEDGTGNPLHETACDDARPSLFPDSMLSPELDIPSAEVLALDDSFRPSVFDQSTMLQRRIDNRMKAVDDSDGQYGF